MISSSLWMGWGWGFREAVQRSVGHRCPSFFLFFFNRSEAHLNVTMVTDKPVVNCADWLLQQRWVGCFCLELKQADTIRFTRLSVSQQWDHQQMFIFDWIIINCKVGFCLLSRSLAGQFYFHRFFFFYVSGFGDIEYLFFFCWLDITGTWSLQSFHSKWFVNINIASDIPVIPTSSAMGVCFHQ